MNRSSPQLFTGRRPPTAESIEPVANEAHSKPTGGLWTSAYLGPAHGSAYIQWCLRTSRRAWIASCWLLWPAPAARLAVVDSLDDLRYLLADFGRGTSRQRYAEYLDWTVLGRTWDGFQLTERGRLATRASTPGLYDWDCESTVWFRWCFERVEALPTNAFTLVTDTAGP